MKSQRKKTGANKKKGASPEPPQGEVPVTPEVVAEDQGSPLQMAEEAASGLAAESPALAQLRDRLLRLQADFDNFRKRTLREKSDIYRNANEDIMLELLPVIDHLELALGASDQYQVDDAFLEGFRLVAEQMASALKKFGLRSVDASNAPFDPNQHEAISHLPSPDVPADQVMTQVRMGYRLGDRVLRASQVVVSSGPPAGDEPLPAEEPGIEAESQEMSEG